MTPSVSAVSPAPAYAVSAGAASSSSAVLQQTSSTSLTAFSQNSSAAVAQGGLAGDTGELLQALVTLLILQTLFGETDQAGTESLLGVLGTLAGGVDGAAASATSSMSYLSYSQTTSTTLAVSQESAAFFAAEAYAPTPTRGGDGYSALA